MEFNAWNSRLLAGYNLTPNAHVLSTSLMTIQHTFMHNYYTIANLGAPR